MATWTYSQPAPGDLASVAGDAVADPAKSAQLLDVEVNEVSGRRVLVTADGLGRLEVSKTG